jgi:mitofusin 2
MNQEHFAHESFPSPAEGSSRRPDDGFRPFPNPPVYMTVGNGITSAATDALMASLNQDSGYGDSISGDSVLESGLDAEWRAGFMEDRQTSSMISGESDTTGLWPKLLINIKSFTHKVPPTADRRKQIFASHVHQLR